MKYEQEILKAQIAQELHVDAQIEGTDVHTFLKCFHENLQDSYDRESFQKSWSADLQKKFPSGGWRTVNGAAVFINGGKVVAGLGGFNRAVDEFFSKKEQAKAKETVGKKEKGNYKHVVQFEDNTYTVVNHDEKLNKVELRKIVGNPSKIKEFTVTDMGSDKKETKEQSPKEEKKEEVSDQPLTDHEQSMLSEYNKDKKDFISKQVESAERFGNKAKETLNKWIEESKNPEYLSMLNEVKNAIEKKEGEPAAALQEMKTKEKELEKFISDDNEEKLDVNKMLQGDVVDNFKKYRDYLNLEKKARKLNGAVENIDLPYRALEGKTAEIIKKPVNVKITDVDSALKNTVSKDDLRPQMMGINYDPEGYKVTTDGNTLIAVKTDVGDKSGQTIDPKTGKNITDGGDFPKWKPLLESMESDKKRENLKTKLSDIHSLTNEAQKLMKENFATSVEIKGVSGNYFNPKLINNTVDSLRKMGVEDVNISYEGSGVKGIIITGQNKQGEEVKAVVMPMLASGESFKIKQK